MLHLTMTKIFHSEADMDCVNCERLRERLATQKAMTEMYREQVQAANDAADEWRRVAMSYIRGEKDNNGQKTT